MSKSLILFLPCSLSYLNEVVEKHQQNFQILLGDIFDESEIESFDHYLETISAISSGPMMSELSFDDLDVNREQEQQQRAFFNNCKSSICLENLPFLDSNPFQVSYLIELLNCFDQALVDFGASSPLMFKEDFLKHLSTYKSIDALKPPPPPLPTRIQKFLPVDPIDFLVADVYQEITRLQKSHKLPLWQNVIHQGQKKLLYVMSDHYLDPATLFIKSGLNPKEFDDTMEKLKFWLKSIH
jgi:hypothetical protein